MDNFNVVASAATGGSSSSAAAAGNSSSGATELEREETLLKIDRMRSLAPSSITEDLANIATVLCNNAANNNRKNMHVHIMMLIDSIYDLAQYWEDVSSRKSQADLSNERTSFSSMSHTNDDISPAQSTLLRVPSNTSATSISPIKTKKSVALGREPSLSDAFDTWKDHDQIEIEELQNKIIKLERQVKLDTDALVKSKITCMNHELLCEENQQLQRTVDNLSKKQQDLISNHNMELTLAKREIKSLHRRIVELTEELSVTKEHVAETSLQTSSQLEDIHSTQQTLQTLELQVSIYENQLKSCHDEKNELNQHIVSLEEELHANEVVKNRLEEEIVSLQQSIANKEKQEAKLYSALQMKSLSEMQSKQQEQQHLQSQKVMDEVKYALRMKEKECQDLKNRYEDLQFEYKKAKDLLLTHQEKEEDKEHVMKMAKLKIDSMQEVMDIVEAEKRDLAMAKESIENDLALERMNASILKEDLLDISRDKVKMMSTITGLQKQLYDLQESLENEKLQKEAIIIQMQQLGHSSVGAGMMATSAVSNTLSALSNRQKSMMTGLFGAGGNGPSNPTTPASVGGIVKSTSATNLNSPAYAARSSSPMPGQVLPINEEDVDDNDDSNMKQEGQTSEVDSNSNYINHNSTENTSSHNYSPPDSASRLSPMPQREPATFSQNTTPATSLPSPTPASYYNGPSEVNSAGSSKGTGLFKFSLPSQINLGKIQLPTSLNVMSMATSSTTDSSAASPVPPSSTNTSAPNANTSSSSSSYGKRPANDINSPPTTSSTILSLARKQSDSALKSTTTSHANDSNGYESYEDNDSDDNDDIGKFRPLDDMADYSYD